MSLKLRKPKQRERPKSGITLIGDMDSAVYACGFAGQRTIRRVYIEDGECIATFISVKEMKQWLEESGLESSDYVVCSHIIPDRLDHVLHSTKLFVEEILHDTQAEDYVFYLTGEGNFRYDIATIQPYKGQRSGDKPVYFNEIREYLINHYGAVVVDGCEADDACTIKATELTKQEKDWIIATRDKDLFQIAGKFYRY